MNAMEFTIKLESLQKKKNVILTDNEIAINDIFYLTVLSE